MAPTLGRRRAAATRAIAAATLVAASLAAGCSMLRGKTEEPPAPKAAADDGQIAVLRGIGGSAVSGKVRVVDRSAGATVLVSAINIPPGTYRMAINAMPNCSSPNGFSAGPAWAPAGIRPQELMPVQYVNSESRVESELRVAGLRATGPNGVAGRSVVIYAGPNVTDARPDVPNERIACGVFEPARPLTF